MGMSGPSSGPGGAGMRAGINGPPVVAGMLVLPIIFMVPAPWPPHAAPASCTWRRGRGIRRCQEVAWLIVTCKHYFQSVYGPTR